MKKKSKEDSKDSPEDILKRIKKKQQAKDRLQLWQFHSRVLWFACGNGQDTVFVNSRKKIDYADKTFDTKLSQNAVRYYCEDKKSISGKYVFDRIDKILKAYIYFGDSRLYSLVSLWIIGTYFYSMFSHYGYLFFFSNLMRSGKTRVQEIISHLAFEASSPQNASTPPVIRELAAEGGTVQLDTLERWREKNQESFSAAMEILDAGFRNGGQAPKMVLIKGDWAKVHFPVYAPYVLTGINKNSLADTALDRSFAIEMQRKPANLQKKRYNYSIGENDCRRLRACLYVCALQNAKAVCDIYQSRELRIELEQLHLNDRAADIWLPILAIAKFVGFEKDSKEWADLVSLASEMGGDPDYAEDARQLAIVQALRKQVDDQSKVSGITSELLKRIQESGIVIKESQLTNFLTLWEFEKKSIRLAKGPRKVWELEDKKLAGIEKQLSVTTS